MSDASDRTLNSIYVPAQTRRWSMDLDVIPNQGQLDTSVPSHAVDLDAIRRSAVPPSQTQWTETLNEEGEFVKVPIPPEWLEERYALPRPTVVHRRRRRSWRQVAFRAAAWVIERAPAILCVVFVAILVAAYLRHATP